MGNNRSATHSVTSLSTTSSVTSLTTFKMMLKLLVALATTLALASFTRAQDINLDLNIHVGDDQTEKIPLFEKLLQTYEKKSTDEDCPQKQLQTCAGKLIGAVFMFCQQEKPNDILDCPQDCGRC